MSLTERQKEVLAFIADAQMQSGVMPSTREIQEHFGFASQTAAVNHLRALERHGVIRRQPGKARAVALMSNLNRGRVLDIPIYGQISAGLGEADENASTGTLSVDAATVGLEENARVFALKVCGDSMTGAHISEGDLVIMAMREPKNEDIVAAIIDGETTLKRYLIADDGPFLRAENPDFPDLVPARELIVQGVMVALIRRCRRPAEAR